MPDGTSLPLIVQSNRTLLLDVHAPLAEECRSALIPFAELESSPEHLHTYQLTPLSLWNAASAGLTIPAVRETLTKYARYPVPPSVSQWLDETMQKFGLLRLVSAPPTMPEPGEDGETPEPEPRLYLVTPSARVYREILAAQGLRKYLAPTRYAPPEDTFGITLGEDEKKNCFTLLLTDRGTIKQALLGMGYPVKDEVPLRDGEPLEIHLRPETAAGKPLRVRSYQMQAARSLVGDRGPGTGFGTIVLPCGAGKTIVGMAIMEMLGTATLIVTTNISAVHQWIAELLDKTTLTADQISEYTGEKKEINAVTIATYQILTWRQHKTGPFPHFEVFRARPWGLIIYDEVHLLPAPVFRVAAELQSIRRAGLTATLVREDGLEGMVFSLVGPKRCDVPWKELEQTGWISSAQCIELRLDLDPALEIDYAVAGPRGKHRLGSENPRKLPVVKLLVERYYGDKILVIGQYIDQLVKIQALLGAPIITGKTSTAERDVLYGKFRSGEIRVLIVSKVANFAIDLPDASMAIQVSGTFGSRQEEAQRLGRILRPKERISRFFSLVTRNTVEEDFSANRQKFLVEQGYDYRLIRYRDESSLYEIDEIPWGSERAAGENHKAVPVRELPGAAENPR
ncbi:MAG: DEAD/DEAH box helicase [Spirochaetaceae bacterium]|nr:DEAD/DEAH box helicase [Spirochaetaceae bacterium]